MRLTLILFLFLNSFLGSTELEPKKIIPELITLSKNTQTLHKEAVEKLLGKPVANMGQLNPNFIYNIGENHSISMRCNRNGHIYSLTHQHPKGSFTIYQAKNWKHNNKDLKKTYDYACVLDPRLEELSGLSASSKHGHYWAHNDGNHPTEIYLINTLGQIVQTHSLQNVKNIDWEDCTSISYNGQHEFWLGDFGDNNAIRKFVTLYRFTETQNNDQLNLQLQETRHYRYPGGPRDAEGLAISVRDNSIFILTKRLNPIEVYRLPLKKPDANTPRYEHIESAELLGSFSLPAGNEARKARKGNWSHHADHCTAFDIDESANIAVFTTYVDTFLFTKSDNESWNTALVKISPKSQQLQRAQHPVTAQSEAACLAPWETNKLRPALIGSEHVPAVLLWPYFPSPDTKENP